MSKVIIFSAPSGAGKSSIVQHLLTKDLDLQFSISATSRPPRGTEKEGVDYFFLSPKEFKNRIAQGDFLEYEEVYPDRFYGTLKSEIDHILANGKNPILDIDCIGGLNVKKIYANDAIAIFIMPPSVEALKDRLNKRGTDSPEVIEKRLQKAEYEMSFAPQFDVVVENHDLEQARKKSYEIIRNFVK